MSGEAGRRPAAQARAAQARAAQARAAQARAALARAALAAAWRPASTAAARARRLAPLLARQSAKGWRQSIYYHYYEYPDPHRVRPHYGVRTATHKLIWFPGLEQGELYDLVEDPGELNNRYDDPACAAVRQQLEAELQRLRQQFGDRN